MSEEHGAVAEEVLGWLQAGEEFVVGQAPLLAEEIITWGRFSATWNVVGLFVLIAVVLWGLFVGWSHSRDWNEGDVVPFRICLVVTAGVVLPISVAGIPGLLLPWLAPRAYVLKELAGLLQ